MKIHFFWHLHFSFGLAKKSVIILQNYYTFNNIFQSFVLPVLQVSLFFFLSQALITSLHIAFSSSPTQLLPHTHYYFQPSFGPRLSNSFTSLLVDMSVLNLLWSSTYSTVWLTSVATVAFWPFSRLFLIRQSSFGYRTRTEFKLRLARL